MLYSSIVKKRIRQSFDHLNNHANSWGRKSLLLIGFGALPIRAALFTVSDNEVWLVSLQVLDGVAAGTLDALIPLVLADVMLGTGRYNAARGVLGTVQGIAGSLSNAAAGFLVVSTFRRWEWWPG